MKARLCKIEGNDYFSLLLSDGTIKNSDKIILYSLLVSHRKTSSIDLFEKGTNGRWDKDFNSMESYPAETYAYINDDNDLVIHNFEPFMDLISFDNISLAAREYISSKRTSYYESRSIDDYISLKEYAAINNKSNEQIKALCQAGRLETARKIGERTWIIHKEQKYPEDGRITCGKFIGVNRRKV